MSDRENKHLRIVALPAEDTKAFAAEQMAFHFARDRHTMFFANIVNASEAEFLGALEQSMPDVICDFRVVPRFDFGRLSRRSVFRRFEDMSARYYDLPCSVGATSLNDAVLNPAFLVEPLCKILRGVPEARRILMLLDNPRALNASVQVLPDRLVPIPKGGWQVRRLGNR